ncbi:MAG: hypothetical protein HRU19_22265 [Pseudobacteriovorax sp.]|nr:hypothetical protein [Pseudobacteriovorax sp.]
MFETTRDIRIFWDRHQLKLARRFAIHTNQFLDSYEGHLILASAIFLLHTLGYEFSLLSTLLFLPTLFIVLAQFVFLPRFARKRYYLLVYSLFMILSVNMPILSYYVSQGGQPHLPSQSLLTFLGLYSMFFPCHRNVFFALAINSMSLLTCYITILILYGIGNLERVYGNLEIGSLLGIGVFCLLYQVSLKLYYYMAKSKKSI